MKTHNSKCKPLLRGVLVEVLTTWRPYPDRPDIEHRQCLLSVWCPFCQRHHVHGWNPANNGGEAEHRGAHCHDPASPFDSTGYFISVYRKSDPEYAAHVVPPGKAIVRSVQVEEVSL